MEIKDRIKMIMEKENMASGAFAESIGIQQSTLSHILNGRNNPSLDVIMKVHQKYNYVNLEWLLYGICYLLFVDFYIVLLGVYLFAPCKICFLLEETEYYI